MNLAISIIVETDKKKTERQIKAIEYQISRDSNPKDEQIHMQALKTLRESL